MTGAGAVGRETWWVAPGAEALLDRRGLASVAAAMTACAGGEVLSTDRRSAAVRLDGDVPLLVKWRRPHGRGRRRAGLRASRERREARAALLAAAHGIPAPPPLAVGERRAGLRLLGSVLVRAWVPDAAPADRALAGASGDLAPRLARTLRGWHDRGWRHGDCYPKNLLVPSDGGEVLPIGAPAARLVRPGPRLDRARARDLAQWTAGLLALGLVAEQDPLAWLATYREGARWRAGALEDRVARRLARVLARKRRRAETRPQREPGGPPKPVPLPPEAVPPPRRWRPMTDLGPSGPGPWSRENCAGSAG